MAFTVQADTGGTANANAYISASYFRDYHRDRGNEITTIGGVTYATTDWQKAIVRATDYIDSRFTFVGLRRSEEQTTEWPRYNAFDRDSNLVSDIPTVIKEACAEYALIALTTSINPTPTRDGTGQIVVAKRSKADVVESEVRYAGGDSFQLPRYPAADMKLIRSGFVIQGTRIRRGD